MSSKLVSIHKNLNTTSGNHSKSIQLFLTFLILFNTLCLILETVPQLKENFESMFFLIETISIAIFSVEYVLRIFSSKLANKDSRSPYLSFVFSPLGLLDLIAVLPYYLPFVIGLDLRTLRLVRLLRIFKIKRYSKALNNLEVAMKKSAPELGITFISIFFLLIITSSLMFFAENRAQPELFKSIPHTMWWSVATLTTVGYGDIYPITLIGKIIGSITALIGIGIVAIPTSIIGANFLKQIESRDAKNQT